VKINDLELKLKKNVKYSICSCGLSKVLPYCDNQHRLYNKKHNAFYKSVKFFLREDNVIEFKCSNWKKKIK
jgi:CDGSH-type Zn-finger protein